MLEPLQVVGWHMVERDQDQGKVETGEVPGPDQVKMKRDQNW